MRTLTLLIAAAGLAACAGQAGADGKITISKAVEADFQSYRSWLTSVGSGAYAVTTDGNGGASAGCRTANCTDTSKAETKALDKCRSLNPGRSCIVFARNLDPVVEYQVGE